MFYIAIWPILLLVLHCIMIIIMIIIMIVDEVSEINRFGEILIRIEFSQMVNQL